MAYNEHVETILNTAEEITELLTNFHTPINEGNKSISDENVGEEHVDPWLQLKDQVEQLIENTEAIWAVNETTDEEVESDE